jgi:hypothetical protein
MVAGDRLRPAQEKLAYCVVMMAGLKSAKKEKGYIVQTNCHASSTGQSHENACQELTFPNFGTGLTLL